LIRPYYSIFDYFVTVDIIVETVGIYSLHLLKLLGLELKEITLILLNSFGLLDQWFLFLGIEVALDGFGIVDYHPNHSEGQTYQNDSLHNEDRKNLISF
jgi:hypothetical protein